MSGVLRPVGPDPARTYWIRRAVLIGLVVATIMIIVAVVRSLVPAEPTQAVPPQAGSPSAEPSQPSGPSSTPTPTPNRTPGATPTPTPSASPKSTPTPTPTPTPPKPPACKASELRLTLIGKRSVEAQEDSKYELSVINGSQQSCQVTVDHGTFELKITSGTDPIWSSRHCDRTLKPVTKVLASEEALAWTMTWNGERSRKDCEISSEVPRPGTYWATAEYDGAEPVKWRMTVN